MGGVFPEISIIPCLGVEESFEVCGCPLFDDASWNSSSDVHHGIPISLKTPYFFIELEGIEDFAAPEIFGVQHEKADGFSIGGLLVEQGGHGLIDHPPVICEGNLERFSWEDVLGDTALRNGMGKERVEIIEVDAGYLHPLVRYRYLLFRSREHENIDIRILVFMEERTGDEAVLRRNLCEYALCDGEPFPEQRHPMRVVDDHDVTYFILIYKFILIFYKWYKKSDIF